MRILWLVCKSCGASFESGVPLCRELLEGVKLRSLEVCPTCGARADYDGAEYRDSIGAPLGLASQDTSKAPSPAVPAPSAATRTTPPASVPRLRERATRA